MTVLLGFSQAAHADVVLLEPARNGVGITPFVFFFSVQSGNFHCTQLFLDVPLVQPIFILIQGLCP